MDRQILRVIRRTNYLILILCLARIAIPRSLLTGGLTGGSTVPAWYETIISLLAALAIIGLITSLVGNGMIPKIIPRISCVLAGFMFLVVAAYVALNPELSVFVSRGGLILSDIGLGLFGLLGWRILTVNAIRERGGRRD